ncbi:MAG: dihydrodipicolinate synthase family protein [Chloroflexi bacterium]|nr:dihydrodipicolinate synthase family protein [Chloroflexota bacterium]
MMKLEGVIPACVTPFVDGRASPEAMKANIGRWLELGVHGLLVFGSTGEFPYVEDEEREPILRVAREAIPSDRLFLVGCGAESEPRARRYVQQAADVGADAALVVTPVYYTRGKSEAQREFYQALAESSPIPILLYNVPAFTAYELPVEIIVELSRHPNIVGVKDSSNNPRRVATELRLCAEDFAVFCGSPTLAFQCLALGAVGGVFAFGNIIPEILVRLYDAVRAGDMERAAGLQAAVTHLSVEIGAWGIPAIKAILAHRGFQPGRPRPPLRPLSPTQAEQAIAVWEEVMASVESGD